MADDDQKDKASQDSRSHEADETAAADKTDEVVVPASPDHAPAEGAAASDLSDAESASQESFDFEIPVTPELDAALASERGQPSKPAASDGKSADEAGPEPPQQKLRIIIDVRTPEPSATPDETAEKPGSPETGSVKSESTPSKSTPPRDSEKSASENSASSTDVPLEQSIDEVEAALNGQPASETATVGDSTSPAGEPLLPIALPVTLRHADRLMLAAFEKLAPEFEQIMRDMTEDCKEEVLWQFTAEMRALNIWR